MNMATSRTITAERKIASDLVKLINALAAVPFIVPLLETSQLQKDTSPLANPAFMSKAIQRHKLARAAAKRHPIVVMFFQSALRREVNVTWVPCSVVANVMLIFFFAEIGEIPHNEPCLT